MTDTEYLTLQVRLMSIATMLREADIEGFLERCERAEALAPIINPTLYMAARTPFELIRDTAKALNEAKRRLPEVQR